MNKKNQKILDKHMEDLSVIQQKKLSEASIQASETRARSITIGTSFGGTSEITMRKNDGTCVWAALQPVEVVELIHQMAANIGCHINLQPRNDFSSWRNWKIEPEMIQGGTHPPFVSSIHPHEARAKKLPKPEEQPGLQPKLMAKGELDKIKEEKNVKTKRIKKITPTVDS